MARRWRKNSDTCSGERKMKRTIVHSRMSSDDQRGDSERGHHHRRLDVVTHPGDRDVAGPVGDPDKAGRQHRDRHQEQDHPDHRALTLARGRAPYRRRIAARRRARPGAPLPFRSSLAPVRAPARQVCRDRRARRDVGLGGVDLDTRQHSGSIVARRRVDRPDAHQPAGIRLQPFEEAALRRLRAGNLQHGRQQRAQFPRQRRPRRHAAGREWRKRRNNVRVGAERLGLRQFGGERRAARHRVAQRRRAQGLPRRHVRRGRLGDVGARSLGGLFERGDALLQGVEFGRRQRGGSVLGDVLHARAQFASPPFPPRRRARLPARLWRRYRRRGG